MAVANEAPCSWLGYGVWSTPRTCFISSLWDVANPRTTKPVSNNLFTFLFARFSQSDLLLTSSDGTVASSKDVERILLHCISRLVIQYYGTVASSKDVERILLHCLSRLVIHYFLSVFLWIVLCTSDALHNKICNDVSEQVCHSYRCPTRWYEPFGESLSRLRIDGKTMSEVTLLNY